MADLKDYSGEFRPGLKLTDFDKDALVRLWHVGGRNYTGRYGQWHMFLKDYLGQKYAEEITRDVLWRSYHAYRTECRRVAEAMNIEDRSVAGFFKFLQWDPAQQGIVDTYCELVDGNPNHGICTATRCWVVDFCERTGREDLMMEMCTADLWGYPECARYFNPLIRAVNLKLPPRQSKDDIACKWELYIPGEA